MSFGVSISDVAMVVNLAWSTLEGAKKACGEHDELTKQLSSLHLTLEHLQSEVANRNSVINSHTGGRRRDLETHIRGCLRHLKRIGSVLTKYNRLQDESGNLWQRIQFGTKGVKDVSESQLKLSTYTTAITLTLHLLSLGSQGRVEKELSRQRGEAKGLRASINLLLAKQNVVSREGTQDGSIRSNPHEEREFWRSFRKELADEGLKSSVIHAHKSLIKAYVKELSDREVLDENTLRIQAGASPPSSDIDRAELDDAPTQRQYQQPTVEDADDDLSIHNLSIDGSHHGEELKDGSTLSEHDEHDGVVAVDDSDKISLGPSNQTQISPPDSSSSLYRTYEQSAVGYTVAPHIMELVEKVQHLEEIDRQRHILLRSINFNHANPVLERRAPPDSADSESIEAGLQNIVTDNVPNETRIPKESTIPSDPNKPLALSVDEYLEILRNNDELEDEALATIRKNAFSRLEEEEQKLTIILEDPEGHRFFFPYYMVKMWTGMQYAVEHASQQMGPHAEQVQLRNYYLNDSDGFRMVPEFWSTLVQPGKTVVMSMRPLPEPPKVADSPTPEHCDCWECTTPAPSVYRPPSISSYGWQRPLKSKYKTPRPQKRAPSTNYQGWQRDSSDRSDSPSPSPKQKPSLSLLFFSPKRKSKRSAPAYIQQPQQPTQPRKKQKRAPFPPRPVSPTPPPPAWWLYERQRRRPPGFERGRSPPARYAVEEVYSRALGAYPDVNYEGEAVFELE